MKQLVLFAIALYAGCVATSLQAQTSFLPERDSSTVSLFEYATKIEKRNNVFDLNLELHADFDATFTAGRADRAAFRFKHVKVEATGEVNDRLFYWYRQQLNGSSNDVGELSNLPASIEYAFIGYHFNSHFTVTAGQQPADFGGYEYDLNPLLIYEYSDMNNYTTC
ncbi:MAG: porin, partial [Tannerellaceae bacterium]